MKRLSILLLLLAITFISCDPIVMIYFKVHNNSSSTVKLTYRHKYLAWSSYDTSFHSLVLKPNQTTIIDSNQRIGYPITTFHDFRMQNIDGFTIEMPHIIDPGYNSYPIDMTDTAEWNIEKGKGSSEYYVLNVDETFLQIIDKIQRKK
jgi:hypothetical protein